MMAAAMSLRSSSSSSLLWMSSLLVLLLCCCYSWRVVDGLGGKVGHTTKIKNIKTNKEIQELGKFSVEEYNKNHHHHHHHKQANRRRSGGRGGDILFSQVVEAQMQVVSGIKYLLKIAASHNGVSKSFDAVVVVKPWVKSKQLLAFIPTTN